MGCLRVAPIVFQIFATLFLIAAICLTLTGILTRYWQLFETADPGKTEIHSHGLWIDCIQMRFSTGAKTETCYFKFHSEDQDSHGDHSGHNHGNQNQNFQGRNQFQGANNNLVQQGQHAHQHKVLSLRKPAIFFRSKV